MENNQEPAQWSAEDLRIDVDKVFRKKGRRIYPFIPGFIISYLKRVVHQNEINDTLPRLSHLQGLDFIEELLKNELDIRMEVRHPENLPGEGRYIVASNHPIGGLDGMAMMHVVGKKRRDIQFLANDILLELKPLASLFAPINKYGRNRKDAIRQIDSLYAGNQIVLIFPAGLVSRKKKGKIADLEWKKSFITKAVQYKRDIVPVFIEGRLSNFFYNLANLRAFLGIKSNIEMLYLADEMYKQRNTTIRLHFGTPIPWTCFTPECSQHDWAQQVKRHVYSLAGGVTEFRKI